MRPHYLLPGPRGQPLGLSATPLPTHGSTALQPPTESNLWDRKAPHKLAPTYTL